MKAQSRITFRPGSVGFDGVEWTVEGSAYRPSPVDAAVRLPTTVRLVIDGGDTAAWIAGLKHGSSYSVTTEAVGSVERVLTIHPRADKAASRSPAPALDPRPLPPSVEAVSDTARAARAVLEADVWPRWLEAIGEDPHPPSAVASVGMCRITVACLLPILRAEHRDWSWRHAGGHPSIAYVERDPANARRFLSSCEGVDGGMWDRLSGQWDGHYWVVGTHGDGSGVIVDITGDQYGWNAVTVTDECDARYRANYTTRELKADFGGRNMVAFAAEAETLWRAGYAAKHAKAPAQDVPDSKAGPGRSGTP